MPDKSKGFTLIELLIVVVIIGVLSGIVIIILNPTVQRNRARDGVRAANMSKLAQAIEAYNATESGYAPDKATLQATLVQAWPMEAGLVAPNDYTYSYTGGSCQEACLSVQMGSKTSYFKYVTGYASCGGVGGNANMVGIILNSCTNHCGTPFNLSGCVSP